MRLLIAALWVFIGLATPAQAQYASSAASVDPYAFGEYVFPCDGGLYDCNRGFYAAGSKTSRNLTVNTAIKNLVLIWAGQSQSGAATPSCYTPTNASAIDNLSIKDGNIYAATESTSAPLLGATWAYQALGGTVCGSISLRVADTLITQGKFDRVIIVPIGSGGSNIALWDPVSNGILSSRPCAAMARLAARGITPSVTNVTFAFTWMQGESDHGTGQSTYQTILGNMKTALLACGFSGRMFIAKETWVCSGGVNSTDTNVQNAQVAAVDNVTIFAGPNADALGTTNRQSDCSGAPGTHFNDTGAAALGGSAAGSWYAAMHASGAPF